MTEPPYVQLSMSDEVEKNSQYWLQCYFAMRSFCCEEENKLTTAIIRLAASQVSPAASCCQVPDHHFRDQHQSVCRLQSGGKSLIFKNSFLPCLNFCCWLWCETQINGRKLSFFFRDTDSVSLLVSVFKSVQRRKQVWSLHPKLLFTKRKHERSWWQLQ